MNVVCVEIHLIHCHLKIIKEHLIKDIVLSSRELECWLSLGVTINFTLIAIMWRFAMLSKLIHYIGCVGFRISQMATSHVLR